MEIVINIPEEDFKHIKLVAEMQKKEAGLLIMPNSYMFIANGCPLPKGHGDLKDIEKIEEAFWDNDLIDKNMDSVGDGESNKMRRAMIRTMLLDVPTIVDADEGVDECPK